MLAFVAVVLIGVRQRGHRDSGPPHTTSAAVPTPSAAALPGTFWPPVAPPLVSNLAPSDGRNTVEICGTGRVAVDPKEPVAVYAKLSTMTDPRSAEVQLAVGASDPAVYAMAIYACHTDRNPVPGECPQLSLSTWAQIDPANAAPWLLLAQQARVRGDEATAANAFARAAKAQKVDSYNYSLFAFADPDQPKGTTPLEQAAFATEVSGIETALRPMYATAAFRYCTEDAVRDAAVKQQCDAMATLLVEKSTTVIDFASGIALGKQSGWPSQRVDTLNQEKFAMMEAQWEAGPIDNDLWSCNSVARINAFWRQRLRLGELGAAREAMVQTGETPEALAKKWEERMSKYAAMPSANE
jgi:hypothetical protein